jgi:hypothetical protein
MECKRQEWYHNRHLVLDMGTQTLATAQSVGIMTPRILNDDIEKEHAEEGNEAKCEGRKKRKKKQK